MMMFFLKTLWGIRHARYLFWVKMYECDAYRLWKTGQIERIYRRHSRLECIWNGWE